MAKKNEKIVIKQTEKKDIRHGCLDCTYYEKPTNKEPCKSCENWSNWEDKRLVNNESN